MEHRLPLGQKEILVSSWLREGALIKDARYHCVAEASTGSDTSEVDLRLTIGGISRKLFSVPFKDTHLKKKKTISCLYDSRTGGSLYRVFHLKLTTYCR